MLRVPGAEVLVLCKPFLLLQSEAQCTERHPLLAEFLEAFRSHCCASRGVSNS